MHITDEEVLELAKRALREMLEANGEDFTFPFDKVWQYVPEEFEVPSGMKPHQAKRLIGEGFLEKTGAMTRATSQLRAGSATPEYRFGRRLKSRTSPVGSDQDVAISSGSLLLSLQQMFEGRGYIISPAELANFYLALITSPLVILSGISGTGKTLLPRLFSQFTGATLHSIPVQPQWSDNSDMLGYVPSLTPTVFKEGKFIPALLEAKNNPLNPVIVLLDEINLAPIEHYFSDFLSVITTVRRLPDGSVTTDRFPIELPSPPAGEDDPFAALRDIHLPRNLKVVGTANMDETTKDFSPKLLDRAFAIEFDDPDLTAFPSSPDEIMASVSDLTKPLIDLTRPIDILEARRGNETFFDSIAAVLDEIQGILKPGGIKFGYRTRDAILLYLYHWKKLELQDLVSANAALDLCLLQKVVPKIAGSGDALGQALETFSEWLGTPRDVMELGEGIQFHFTGPFERCREKVDRMRLLLESDGATFFWGV